MESLKLGDWEFRFLSFSCLHARRILGYCRTIPANEFTWNFREVRFIFIVRQPNWKPWWISESRQRFMVNRHKCRQRILSRSSLLVVWPSVAIDVIPVAKACIYFDLLALRRHESTRRLPYLSNRWQTLLRYVVRKSSSLIQWRFHDLLFEVQLLGWRFYLLRPVLDMSEQNSLFIFLFLFLFLGWLCALLVLRTGSKWIVFDCDVMHWSLQLLKVRFKLLPLLTRP